MPKPRKALTAIEHVLVSLELEVRLLRGDNGVISPNQALLLADRIELDIQRIRLNTEIAGPRVTVRSSQSKRLSNAGWTLRRVEAELKKRYPHLALSNAQLSRILAGKNKASEALIAALNEITGVDISVDK